MPGRGKYVRTKEIRDKARENAFCSNPPCPDDCTCGKHSPRPARSGKKCPHGCTCLRHTKSPEHKARIGLSVSLTAEAKRSRVA